MITGGFLLLLLALAPSAPSGLTIAALVQDLPVCSLGNGFDANHDGTIDTGCPGSDEMVTTSTGKAGHFSAFRKAGTAVNFADAAADGGTAVRVPINSNYLSGQIASNVTLGNGNNTVWVQAKTPAAGKTGLRIHTSPVLNTNPDAGTRFQLTSSQGYTWTKLPSTFAGDGKTQTQLYFVPDDSVELACIYADLNSAAVPQCDTGTVPQVPQYTVLNTSTLPTGVSDTIWLVANTVTLNGGNTGVTSTPVVKVLWNSAANKFCFYQELTAANLLAATTSDDDANVQYDSSLLIDWRNNQTPVADLNTYRFIVNGNASPALLDANWPSGGFDSTVDLTNVTRSQSYSGGVMKMMLCATAPATLVADSITLTNYSAIENVNGTVNSKRAVGSSSFPIPTTVNEWILTQWSSTVASTPADTTAPVVGTPSLVSNSNNSQTWSVSCSDAVGCQTVILDYDTNSGTPYASSQQCTVTGSAPTFSGSCVISNLTAATSYFVRGRATDGAGNSGTGAETNGATTSSATFYIATNGTGTKASTGCVDTSAATRCPIGQLQNTAAGETWLLKNGTYTMSGPITRSCSGGGSGSAGNPVTIQAENERQAFLSVTTGNDALHILNCSYYRVIGLRFANTFNGGNENWALLRFDNSPNAYAARNLFQFCGSTNTSQIFIASGSNGSLVEENEFYSCPSHNLQVYHSTNVEVRRNYGNTRKFPGSLTRGNALVAAYPGPGTIAENNIGEGYGGSTVDNEALLNDSNVKMLGNIAIGNNNGVTLQVCRQEASGLPTNLLVRDNVSIGGIDGIKMRGSASAQVTNNTVYTTLGNSGIYYDDNPGGGCKSSSVSATLTNNLVLAGANNAMGFNMASSGWTSQFARFWAGVFSGTTAFSPSSADGRWGGTASSATNPALGSCSVYIPSGSPMQGAGAGGADIGATVLYKYEGGLQQVSSGPNQLWDPTQTGTRRMEAKRASGGNGGWAGAIIAGVNDIAGSSLFDVNTRLGFVVGGCPNPPGY